MKTLLKKNLLWRDNMWRDNMWRDNMTPGAGYKNVYGMSLRDYFAAKAMQAEMSDISISESVIAKRAYAMADAMLEARNKDMLDDRKAEKKSLSDEAVKKDIQVRLRIYRDQENRTQQQLADVLGVTIRQVIRWEKGESRPTDKMLNRMKELHII